MTYALDSTASSSSNLVVGEKLSITTAGLSSPIWFLLDNALFYGKNLKMTYTDANGAYKDLSYATDFVGIFQMVGPTVDNPIFAGIKVLNLTLNGTISLTYQAVGGAFTIDEGDVTTALTTAGTYNPQTQYLALTPTPPLYANGSSTALVLSGVASLVTALQTAGTTVALTVALKTLPTDGTIAGQGGTSDIIYGGPYITYNTGSTNSGAGTQGTGTTVSGTNIAQETGGNLDTIAARLATVAANTATAGTQSTAIAVATGAPNDGAWTTGTGSIISLLKAVVGKLAGVLQIRTLSSSTDSVSAAITGSVTVGSSALPTGAATDASLQTLITAVRGTVSMDGTIWTDNTVNPPLFYIRRETYNQTTGTYAVAWETPAGAVVTPTVANLKAIGDVQNIARSTTTYTATASGTGYATGDIIIHSFGIDTTTTPNTLAYSFWFNAGPSVANGAVLTAAPASNTITLSTGASSSSSTNNGLTVVLASDGVYVPIDSLAHTYGYDSTGSYIVTDQVVYNSLTYIQTLTYTNGNITGTSAWVKQ